VSTLNFELLKLQYAKLITGDLLDDSFNLTKQSPIVETAHIQVIQDDNLVTINALFPTETLAEEALANMDMSASWFDSLQGCTTRDGPDVYAWTARSSSDPLPVDASGFQVESVTFSPTCLNSGCWVVDVTYTIGTDDFNTFFLPRASADDSTTFDPDYSTVNLLWSQSPEQTFDPNTHPCTTANYNAGNLPATITACCLVQYFDMYRSISSFQTAVAGKDFSRCGNGLRDRVLSSNDTPVFVVGEFGGDSGAPDGVYVDGVFSELVSYGEPAGTIDPYVGVYKARFYLDEIELRTAAGKRRGTVGVEHTVDTFIGQINLSPTGTYVLDTFATQTAIHLEKTSFFSVSTHGTNDYTFLEYVNMRLVAVYEEDTDFSGADESGLTTVRTDKTGAAHFIQVTFTLGPSMV
jgi:hypothetical protein